MLDHVTTCFSTLCQLLGFRLFYAFSNCFIDTVFCLCFKYICATLLEQCNTIKCLVKLEGYTNDSYKTIQQRCGV
jgi:hypothetical protein